MIERGPVEAQISLTQSHRPAHPPESRQYAPVTPQTDLWRARGAGRQLHACNAARIRSQIRKRAGGRFGHHLRHVKEPPRSPGDALELVAEGLERRITEDQLGARPAHRGLQDLQQTGVRALQSRRCNQERHRALQIGREDQLSTVERARQHQNTHISRLEPRARKALSPCGDATMQVRPAQPGDTAIGSEST